MLRLPRLRAVGDVVGVPPRVAPGVDLDDVGAEVGEHLGAERAGDGETEVEHGDPLERRPARSGAGRPGAAARSPRSRRRQHLVGVLADPRDRPLHRSGGAAQPVEDAGLAQRPVLGVVDVDDGAARPPAPGRQRLLRGADRLERHAGLRRDRRPTRRSGTGRTPPPSPGSSGRARRCSPGRAGSGRDRRARCSTSRRTSSVSPVGAAEHEARVRHPVLDPAPVGAPEEALRGPAVVDPRPVADGVGSSDPSATSTRSSSGRPGGATSRRAGPGPVCSRANRAALMPGRGQEGGAQAGPRACR